MVYGSDLYIENGGPNFYGVEMNSSYLRDIVFDVWRDNPPLATSTFCDRRNLSRNVEKCHQISKILSENVENFILSFQKFRMMTMSKNHF